MSKSITVFQDNIKVGYLKYTQYKYTFEYDAGYNGCKLIGLNAKSDNKSNELYPIFENLLPEGNRREKLLNSLKSENLLDALLSTKETHGNFDFITTEDEKEYIKSNSKMKYNWTDLKDKILGKNKYPNVVDCNVLIDDAILDDKNSINYSSLSGYQNKIDVSFKGDKLLAVQENSTYLLKPFNRVLSEYKINDKTSGKFPYLSLLEHRDMSFFKNEFGFDVPESGIIKADNQFHYIVKRYDRFEGYKIKQFDFAQLMNVKSEDKYDFSSEALFEKIDDILGDNNSKLKALKFYFASSIIQNNDLHLKNISVIDTGNGKFELAPLYDVISTGTYSDKDNDLALSIKDKSTHQKGKFTVKSFYGLADILGIDKSVFKVEAEKILEIYLEKMPEYIENSKQLLDIDSLDYKVSKYKTENFIDKMQRSFNYRGNQLKKVGML